MEMGGILIGFALGLLAGGVLTWLFLRSSLAVLKAEAKSAQNRQNELIGDLAQKETAANELRLEISRLREELTGAQARMEAEAKAATEKQKLLDEAREKLSDAFANLSSKALEASRQSFFDLAKTTFEKYQEGAKNDLEKKQLAFNQLVEPIQKKLGEFDGEIRKLEKAREGAYAGLLEQVKGLAQTQQRLHAETGSLVKALRSPSVRGRWGEMQLRRTVEMAGMVGRVDFSEQQNVSVADGRLRPDMVIHLPNKRTVVVDAKVTAEAYLRSLEADSTEAQALALKDHARQVRDQVNALGRKAYWEQFEPTPDFVVLFLPLECLFSAALEQDPQLIEDAVNEKVILASPTTLIALLKAVGYGWRQEEIAEEARTIAALGKELYRRMGTFTDHFMKLGKGLDRVVSHYNSTVASLETRLLPQARKMQELPIGEEKELPLLEPIERAPREPSATEEVDDDAR